MTAQQGGVGRRWLLMAPMLPALLAMAVIHIGLVPEPGTPMDEGVLLVYPQLMLHGAVPHRDFQTFYAPGNLWILENVYRVFGPSVAVERLTGVAYELVLVSGLFALVRRWGGVAAGAAALVVTLLVAGLGFGALNWLPAVAALAWSMWCLMRNHEVGSLRLAAVAGVLGSATMNFRAEMGVIAVAAAAVVFLRDRRAWFAYLAGFALGLVPLLVHLVAAGPGAVYSNVVVDAIFRTGPQRRLPLLGQPLWIEGMELFIVMACLVLLVAGREAGHHSNALQRRALLMALAVAIAFVPEAVQRLDMQHAIFASLFSAAFLCGVAADAARRGLETGGRRSRLSLEGGVLTAVCILLPVAIAMRFDAPPIRRVFTNHLGAQVANHEGRSWPVGSGAELAEVDATLRAVEGYSKPGQRLFVGPSDLRKTFMNESFLYYLLPRLTVSTYYVEMEPGSTNRQGSRLASDVASADILVLSRRFNNPGEPNASGQPGSAEANRVVAREFCPRSTAGDFEVFTRCRPR